jgi:orotidine-5'-phosphate decarboxylase
MAIPKEKLIVALDTTDQALIQRLLRLVADKVGMFKVGSQAFTAHGPLLVSESLMAGGKVFLDLKFHDIPNTVGAAVDEAVRLGVSLLTLHASGGRKMLEEAARRLREARGPDGKPRTRAVAVTVLTSMDRHDIVELGISRSVEKQVLTLAGFARDAGLDGIVASPLEASLVREAYGPDFLNVVPGIRPAEAGVDDQKRVSTPREAIARGASYIVVGRPILKAPDPVAAVEEILSSPGTGRPA